MHARRLQMQERMTVEIAHTLQRMLEPKGVGLIVEAKHMCTMVRGAEKIHARMVTRAMLGSFEDAKRRNECISPIGEKDEDATHHHHDHQHEERSA
jgi:GTP cyclohydrolase I